MLFVIKAPFMSADLSLVTVLGLSVFWKNVGLLVQLAFAWLFFQGRSGGTLRLAQFPVESIWYCTGLQEATAQQCKLCFAGQFLEKLIFRGCPCRVIGDHQSSTSCGMQYV